MKSKLTEEIKEIFSQGMNWAKLEVEYLKLTASEKLVVLTSAMIIGGVVFLLLLPVFLMLLFALVDVFKMWVSSPLAYLIVSGIVILILAVILVLRKPLVINPVSRYLTKVILDSGHHNK